MPRSSGSSRPIWQRRTSPGGDEWRGMNILVLSVTYTGGQALIEAARHCSFPVRVLAGCQYPLSVGLQMADQAFLMPSPRGPDFLPWLFELCRKEEVQAVCSIWDFLLDLLSEHREELHSLGIVPLVADRRVREIARDKLATYNWFKENQLPFARSTLPGDVDGWEFPLVLKPRRSSGAVGFQVVEEASQLEGLDPEKWMVQEYLGERQEYDFEVTLYRDRQGKVCGLVPFEGTPRHETCTQVEFKPLPEVRQLAVQIAEQMELTGPANLQFRFHEGGPVCFEINARFPGEVGILASRGVNLLEAALRENVLEEPVEEMPRIEEGMAVRYWSYVVTPMEQIDRLSEKGKAP